MHGFQPIVPFGADQTIYLVIENPGPHAIAGSAERTDIETVISDLLSGRFSDPIEVLAFNTIEHWSNNLSKDVAREIRCRCDIEGHDVPAHLQEFVSRGVSPDRCRKAWWAPNMVMTWVYWDTFWSLAGSLVWFMTIVSHPDAVVTER